MGATMVARGQRAFRPRLVLGHADADYTSPVSRHFRQLGWEVHVARTGDAVRRLVSTLDPMVVVLATELPDESGWLICAKLLHEQPERKIVLVSTRVTSEDHSFAEFVGAAGLVGEFDSAPALLDTVHGTALSAV